MLASLMFYRDVPKGEPAQENQVAGFSFTWKQVRYISLCSKLVNIKEQRNTSDIFDYKPWKGNCSTNEKQKW